MKRPLVRSVSTLVVVFFVTAFLPSCAGTAPANLGVSFSRLTPCPSSPNCVSSDSAEASQRVDPLQLVVPPSVAWRAAVEAVARMPRTAVVVETSDYLRAECRSKLFGFVDDLELNLRVSDNLIAVRSASRVGYSDLGVNRGRVEMLRAALAARGVARPDGE